MLEIRNLAPHQTASLSECGGAVMLELEDGNGHAFRQALDARDAGKVLGVCNAYSSAESVCQGDLVVGSLKDGGVRLTWQQDGGNPTVRLGATDMFVFEEALKAHCKALMKPGRTPIL